MFECRAGTGEIRDDPGTSCGSKCKKVLKKSKGGCQRHPRANLKEDTVEIWAT